MNGKTIHKEPKFEAPDPVITILDPTSAAHDSGTPTEITTMDIAGAPDCPAPHRMSVQMSSSTVFIFRSS